MALILPLKEVSGVNLIRIRNVDKIVGFAQSELASLPLCHSVLLTSELPGGWTAIPFARLSTAITGDVGGANAVLARECAGARFLVSVRAPRADEALEEYGKKIAALAEIIEHPTLAIDHYAWNASNPARKKKLLQKTLEEATKTKDLAVSVE